MTTVIAKMINSLALAGRLLLLDLSGVVGSLSLSSQRSHLRNGRVRIVKDFLSLSILL